MGRLFHSFGGSNIKGTLAISSESTGTRSELEILIKLRAGIMGWRRLLKYLGSKPRLILNSNKIILNLIREIKAYSIFAPKIAQKIYVHLYIYDVLPFRLQKYTICDMGSKITISGLSYMHLFKHKSLRR